MRKIALALAAWLLAALPGPVAAQVPPPVPALPDTQRLTSYSLSASTCICSIGFALYGDSTDVDNWIEVWISGTRWLSTDAAHGWALTSATGPLATIPRPVTNAVLTFTAVQTGTVQILGAQRPRRLSQFAENRGVAARDLNQVITGLTAMEREFWDFKTRAYVAPVGGTGGIISGVSSGVFGPGSSTVGQVAVFGGTTGAVIAGGPVLTDGQLFVGQTGAPFLGKTITGDVTINAAGATAIGANKVTPGMIQTQFGATLFGVPGASTATPTAFSLFSLPFSSVVNGSQDILMIRANSDGAFHYTTPLGIVASAGGGGGGGGSACYAPIATAFFCGSTPSGIQSDAVDNTAYGYNALMSVAHSGYNTAVGAQALQSHTSDLAGVGAAVGWNVAVGYQALLSDANSDENAAVGYQALKRSIGHSPGWTPAGLVMNGTCVSGSATVTVASTTGITAGQIVQATCFPNNNRGTNFVLSITDATHFVMTENANVSTTVSMDFNADLTGGKNVAIGSQALVDNYYGHYNTCVGLTACQWETIGRENTGIGATALDGCTSCSLNTAIGANALGGYYNPPTNGSPFGTPLTGTGNSVLGYNTIIFCTTCTDNIAIGTNTGISGSTMRKNIFIGNETMMGDYNPVAMTGTPISGIYNTVLGSDVSGITTGNYNNILCSQVALSNPSNNIVICDGQGNQRITSNANGIITLAISAMVGGASAANLAAGNLGITNRNTSPSNMAPGAGSLKLEVVCGTGAGTSKLVAYAGTSNTPTTILDNIGAGATGC